MLTSQLRVLGVAKPIASQTGSRQFYAPFSSGNVFARNGARFSALHVRSAPVGRRRQSLRPLRATDAPESTSNGTTTATATVAAAALPQWKWEDSDDAVKAYSALFGMLMLGQIPAAQQNQVFDVLYFLTLAVLTIYIGAHRGLTTDQRQQLNLKEGLLAPVAASAALFGTYLLIKFLPDLSLQSFLDVYFWLLGSIAISGAFAPIIKKVTNETPQQALKVGVPQGWFSDSSGPVDSLEVSPAELAGLGLGVLIASLDLAAHHNNFTLNNVMACTIAAEILQLLGIRSFRVAGLMLVGLLLYDVFWVFGSSNVVGDNVMLTVATSDAIVAPTKLLFPKIGANPMSDAADYPYALLGLGDVALPGLLACLALRYDASRSTDMRSRAHVAADAMNAALADLEAGASSRQIMDASASAAEAAYDDFADREQRQRDGAVASSSGRGGAGPSQGGDGASGAEAGGPVAVSDAVLYQRTYFTPVIVMYVVGLLMAFAANSVTSLGQPALLYLVPCTLGAVAVNAAVRGELGRVWNFTDVATFGMPESSKKEEGEEKK